MPGWPRGAGICTAGSRVSVNQCVATNAQLVMIASCMSNVSWQGCTPLLEMWFCVFFGSEPRLQRACASNVFRHTRRCERRFATQMHFRLHFWKAHRNPPRAVPLVASSEDGTPVEWHTVVSLLERDRIEAKLERTTAGRCGGENLAAQMQRELLLASV